MSWRLISVEEKTSEEVPPPPPLLPPSPLLQPQMYTHPSGHKDKQTGLLTGTPLCVSQLLGKTSSHFAEQITATACLSLSHIKSLEHIAAVKPRFFPSQNPVMNVFSISGHSSFFLFFYPLSPLSLYLSRPE